MLISAPRHGAYICVLFQILRESVNHPEDGSAGVSVRGGAVWSVLRCVFPCFIAPYADVCVHYK